MLLSSCTGLVNLQTFAHEYNTVASGESYVVTTSDPTMVKLLQM